MTTTDFLADAFERVRDALYPAVNGLSVEELTYRPDEESNTIAWLTWHLTRVQDDAIAGLAGDEPLWTAHGWFDRYGLALDPADTGYGHDPKKVAIVVVEAGALLDYFEDVHQRTVSWVRTLDEADLSRQVGGRWEPPAAIGQKLLDVLVDDLQHTGQAAYVRGVVQRRGR
jgi:uncharacterized damage-inducible protein DinB